MLIFAFTDRYNARENASVDFIQFKICKQLVNLSIDFIFIYYIQRTLISLFISIIYLRLKIDSPMEFMVDLRKTCLVDFAP